MKSQKFVFFALSIGILIALEMPLLAQSDDRTILLSGTLSTKNSYTGRWLEMIYTEAFKRLGYRLDYQGFPAKRASYMSDKGLSDGEIHRIATYGNKHPQLVRVEEPHFNDRFIAFSTREDITLDGWESLKNRPLKVGHRRGVAKTSQKLATIVPVERITEVPRILSGLRMLSKGRMDIYIDAGLATEDILRQNPDLKNIRIAGIMEELSTHAFLHSRHQILAEKLTLTLRDMKDEGLIKKFAELAK